MTDKAELIAEAIDRRAEQLIRSLGNTSEPLSERIAGLQEGAAIARSYRIPEGSCSIVGVGEIS